jgi:branched-chain amino acid transport system ATP-binding protein
MHTGQPSAVLLAHAAPPPKSTHDAADVEIARAVATGPKLIVLDEALSGIDAAETRDALEVLRGLRARGIALLVVEHVMEVIMAVSDRVVVLDAGRRIAEGPPEEIARDPRVIEAYLGA